MGSAKSGSRRVRIGVDVGGTFTDVVLIDQQGQRWHAKVPSTPSDPSQGFLKGLYEVLDAAGAPPNQIKDILHGTTVATNAVLQRRGAKISLITTKGFEDLLEIGRQQRPLLYDIFVDRVPVLVPKERCFGAIERVTANGNIHTELKEKEALRVAQVAGEGAEAVAVCLLFAYKNPVHEQQLEKHLRSLYPDIPVSLSSEVLPEFREYERMSTTTLDAYVTPILSTYLHRLERALKSSGLEAPLLIMQSHGGLLQSSLARQHAVRLLFSGLAGGTLGGRYTSQIMGEEKLITFDMGGTSTDVALISEGEFRETSEGSIGGLPCRVPMVDVETVGAGGGSIAWIDEGGVLRVGPQSAGAEPGPCCYDLGGREVTVTDANLLLGRLNPDYFLGGKLTLKRQPAREQLLVLSRQLGLSEEECAFGILRIVNSNMERAIRLVSIQRGYDPREFALVAFGGAGPMHAWALAKDLGIPRVIIPVAPGLHSALGLLATNLRCDRSLSVLLPASKPDIEQLDSVYKNLESKTRQLLYEQGVTDRQVSIQRLADLRYQGQSYELVVNAPKGKINSSWVAKLLNTFNQQHEQRFGYSTPKAAVTIVNLRVVAIGPMPQLKPPHIPVGVKYPTPKERRPVYFEMLNEFVSTPVYERSSLGCKSEIIGPVIIEQLDSTTVIHPKVRAVIRRDGNIILEEIE
ncbi:MAG: hydantoinase/oxoprolinase family protein [Promethearchaeota archaeon]